MERRNKGNELASIPAMKSSTRRGRAMAGRDLPKLSSDILAKGRAKEGVDELSVRKSPSSAPASRLGPLSAERAVLHLNDSSSEYGLLLQERASTFGLLDSKNSDELKPLEGDKYVGRVPGTACTFESYDSVYTNSHRENRVLQPQPPIVYKDQPKDMTRRAVYSVDRAYNLRAKSGIRIGLPKGYSDRKFLEELEKMAEQKVDLKASQFLRRYRKARRRCEEGYFDDFDNFGDGAFFEEDGYEEDPIAQVSVKPWNIANGKYKRMSKGKRLWIKALRLIKLRKGRNVVVSRPAECKADVSFDEHGKEHLVLTTMPENEDRVQVERTSALLLLKAGSNRRRRVNRPSVTLEDVLRWYTDRELQRDDQILRAMENAALRKLRKAEEAAELRRWLARPNPSIEVKDLTAEAFLLELKLAFSIARIREMVKAQYPCSIVRSSNDVQFVDWWSTGALESARCYFLELEIKSAAQDPVVRAKASESGLTLNLKDKTSTKRIERQRWRDFCAWYFQDNPVVREQFLQEHSKRLDSYLESSWYHMKKELDRFPDARTNRQIKKMTRKRHKTVIEVVDSVVEDLNELPHRLELEAFKSPPEELILERELHNEFGHAVMWKALDDETKTLELKMALRSRAGRYYILREGFDVEELLSSNPLIWNLFSAWYGGHSKLRRHLLRKEIASLVQSPSVNPDGKIEEARRSLLEDLRPSAIDKLQNAWKCLDDDTTDPDGEQCTYTSYIKPNERSACVAVSRDEAIELSQKLLETVKLEVQRSVDVLFLECFRQNQGIWRRYGYKYQTDDLEEGETVEIAEGCALQELEDLQFERLLELLSLTTKLEILWATLTEMLEVLRLLEQSVEHHEAPREYTAARARLMRFSSESLRLWSTAVEKDGVSALENSLCGLSSVKERLRLHAASALLGDVSALRCTCCTSSVVQDLTSIGITCSVAEFKRLSDYSLVLTKACVVVPPPAISPFQALDYELLRVSNVLPQLVGPYMNDPSYRQGFLRGLIERHEKFSLEQNEREEETEGVCILDPIASVLSPPIDKWALRKLRLAKIMLWYSPQELDADDVEMERSELMGRMHFEQEQKARMNTKASGFESGSEESESSSSSSESSGESETGSSYVFTSPIDTENNLEYSVAAVLQMAAEIQDLDISEETYEEAERRRMAELMSMRQEERNLRRWIAETRRHKLMQDTELALNREVEKQKQDELERRNDRDGMTVAEREEYENMCMAKEDEECQERWKRIDEDLLKRLEWEAYIREISHRRMVEEDNYSYLFGEKKKEEEAIEASRALSERKLMESEDLHSYLCRPLWERERQQGVVWNALMSAAYAPFNPYYSSPKTDSEIFAGVEISSHLEFHPKGNVPTKREVDIHLSNKFQQVLGIPSNFRIPPLGKKPEKPKLRRSKTLSRMKLSSMHWQDSRDEGRERNQTRPFRLLASAPIRMPASQGSSEHGCLFPTSRRRARGS